MVMFAHLGLYTLNMCPRVAAEEARRALPETTPRRSEPRWAGPPLILRQTHTHTHTDTLLMLQYGDTGSAEPQH